LVVSDTGIGIPKDKQEIIFEPFRQASEGLSRSYEGTGLGLSIVRKYVDLLNGTIKLNSDIGLGTSFTIELPVEEITKKEVQNNKEDNYKEYSEVLFQQTSSPRRLLYVEDDELSQSVVMKTLFKYYEIDLVKSAEEALNILEEKTYDALLIDVNLGYGMDGVQLTEKIRTMHHYRNVPIIAVTAYASELDRKEFLSRGFSHYISKPFSITDLKKIVANVFYKV
jgi:CheY-like chemotaxis protein